MQVERYRELNGHYPELLLVDKRYLTRENRRYLKERDIRHTEDSLGRKPVRNLIEGKFGLGKNGYNLNHIRARLSSTSMSWIAAIIFVLNLIRHTKGIVGSILNLFLGSLMKLKYLMTQQLSPFGQFLVPVRIIQ